MSEFPKTIHADIGIYADEECPYGDWYDKPNRDTTEYVRKDLYDFMRDGIEQEAQYCERWAQEYAGTERGARHQERANRLRALL